MDTVKNAPLTEGLVLINWLQIELLGKLYQFFTLNKGDNVYYKCSTRNGFVGTASLG